MRLTKIWSVFFLLLLCSCAQVGTEDFVYGDGLYLIQETDNGKFYSPHKDDDAQQVIKQLAQYFESNYERITNMFHYAPADKTIVHVYTDRAQFYEIMGRKTEGTYDANDKIIKVFTPPQLSDPVIYSEYTFQIVHEFIHAIIQQINPIVGNVKWLDEGTAYYASLQLEAELEKNPTIEAPSLEQIYSPAFFDDFGSAAYFYSGLIIKFIVERYGMEALNEIIRAPLEIETILNTSIDKLYLEWISYLE